MASTKESGLEERDPEFCTLDKPAKLKVFFVRLDFEEPGVVGLERVIEDVVLSSLALNVVVVRAGVIVRKVEFDVLHWISSRELFGVIAFP